MQSNEPLARALTGYDGPPVRIMEVCGTHTAEGFRNGIRSLLPPQVKLIAGPGCPVCVTPAGFIDKACWLARHRDVLICSFGDLVRVPGSEESLAALRARGRVQLRVVYSPLDALAVAAEDPRREVVFLSVGFETTVPAACLAVKKAAQAGVGNFSLLCSNRTMEEAYHLLHGAADAFLYPGHVSAITGMEVYRRLAAEGISGAVAGFGAQEMLLAIDIILKRLAKGMPFAVNCYTRVVTPQGSEAARALIAKVMEPCDARWRGLGVIPHSGLRLRAEYERFDAEKRFSVPPLEGRENPACRCGDVLRGSCEPPQCACFGKACKPENPLGPCMVSSEGTCAAYYQYGGLPGNDRFRT
ncbi:MAG: hydrogenase formation protein HypD [Clostridia bacterium]|nr:hydrogenase formation protein HypD [Clostridia bacterium]